MVHTVLRYMQFTLYSPNTWQWGHFLDPNIWFLLLMSFSLHIVPSATNPRHHVTY